MYRVIGSFLIVLRLCVLAELLCLAWGGRVWLSFTGALRAREARGPARLTVNLLKPLIFPGWSCISISSFAEASAVEGSDSTLRVFADLAILPVGAVRGERSQTCSRKDWQAGLEADSNANGASG